MYVLKTGKTKADEKTTEKLNGKTWTCWCSPQFSFKTHIWCGWFLKRRRHCVEKQQRNTVFLQTEKRNNSIAFKTSSAKLKKSQPATDIKLPGGDVLIYWWLLLPFGHFTSLKALSRCCYSYAIQTLLPFRSGTDHGSSLARVFFFIPSVSDTSVTASVSHPDLQASFGIKHDTLSHARLSALTRDSDWYLDNAGYDKNDNQGFSWPKISRGCYWAVRLWWEGMLCIFYRQWATSRFPA